jgi:HSP20 family molecular chaperone IbpA
MSEELEALLERQQRQHERLEELKQRTPLSTSGDDAFRYQDASYDLHQRDDEVFLSIDVPGVLEESVAFDFQDAAFFVTGEFPASEPDHAVCVQQNRLRGPFRYQFLLPRPAQRFESYQENGVLYLRIQLQPEE